MKTLINFIAKISSSNLIYNYLALLILFSCNDIEYKHNSESFLRKFMQEKYEVDWEKVEYLSAEVIPFIYDKDNPPILKYIKSPLLEVKIGYKFYLTSLRTSHSEYPEVEVIFAVDTINWTEPMMLPSPVFTNTPEEFIQIFYGIKSASAEEQFRIAKEIAELFKIITYQGEIVPIANVEFQQVSFALQHNNRLWRNLDINFQNDQLSKINIFNPITGRSETTTQKLEFENRMSNLGVGIVQFQRNLGDAIYYDSVRIYNDSDFTSYADWNVWADSLDIVPLFYDPEYSIINFVCLEKGNNYYKILINYNKEGYLKPGKLYQFDTWEQHLKASWGVSRKEKPEKQIKVEPSESATNMIMPDEEFEMFCVAQVQGDWLRVTYDCFYNQVPDPYEGRPCHDYIKMCKNPVTGWIRWRKDNHLLVNIYTMP